MATGEQIQSEQLQSGLFRTEVSTQTGKVTMPEASNQTEQPTLDSPQPMFEEYPDNMDEACINPKTPHLETNENQWPDLLSPPNGDRHNARRRRFVNDSDMMSRLPAANGLILRPQSIANRLHLIAPRHHPFLNIDSQSKARNL